MKVPPLSSALFVSLLLCSCASERERNLFSAWSAAALALVPAHEPATPITSATPLSEYVRRALERSPRLRSRSQRWRAALEKAPQARALPNPRLMVGGYAVPIETRAGPTRFQIGLSQRVPWPGKLLAASDVSLERADAERARYDGAQLRLVADVSMAYAALHYLTRNIQVTRDTLALVQRWESVAQGQLQAGRRGAQRDVIRAQVELGRLEDRVQSLENARLPLHAKLNGLLNQPPEGRLPSPTTLPEPTLPLSDGEVMDLARRQSPALRALDHETGARERGVDLAYQSYLPDFSVGAMFTGVSTSRFGSSVPNSGDDPVLATIGIELPIWFGRYGASVSEAKARLLAAESDRKNAENDLMANVATALFTFRDAERKVSLYRDSLLAKARQALEATAAAYEAGQGSFLDVLDSERKLIEFELAHERARADRVAAMARLEALVGTELQQREGVQ